eukprot:GEMP01065559.1.p1 GENE.GEMP01065559.1~~GEMP01065559.1.p1  ORF type:complete len:366 (+),score=64.80 GEMP01065559.1:96-1100(+)
MRFGMMFAGCIFAQIFIEYILKYDAGAANCVTLAEISVVLVHAMLTSSRRTLLLQEKLRARMDHHVIHALLWVTISWLVNWAYSWKVGVPLHTLFRSSNIVSNVVVGVILFKHRYSTIELLGVVAVTAGIFLATIADASGRSCAGYTCSWADIVSGSAHPQIGEEDDTLTWKIGIGILVIVSLLQGLLGHVQKQMYDVTVGDRTAVANEFLFISHAFALVPSLFFSRDIIEHGARLIEAPSLHPALPIPYVLVMLLMANFCRIFCITGVFQLSALHSPLTMTIAMSIRKFVTVCVSVVWFQNPWTVLHTLAVALVFGGGLCHAAASHKSRKKMS